MNRTDRWVASPRGRRSRHRALTTVVSVAAVAGLSLTSLSGCSSSTGAGNEKVTISGYVWSDWAYVFDAAKAFEKTHPNVTVKLNAIPSATYFNTLPQLFNSSNTPDFSVVPRDGTLFPKYVSSGILEPLDDVWSASGLDTHASATVKSDYTASDGKLYQISAGLTAVPVIYYNKAVFARAGITAPAESGPTMAEFYSMTDKLKAAGVDALAAPLGVQPLAARIFAPYLVNSCGTSWLNSIKKSTTSDAWSNPCVTKAFQVVREWTQKGVFAGGTGATTQQQTVAQAAFVSGKAGMYIDGSYAASEIRTASPHTAFGWFLAPSATTAAMKMTTSDVDAIGISKKSPHVKITKEFLEYLAKDAGIWQHGFPPRDDLSSAGATTDPVVVQTYDYSKKDGSWADVNQFVSSDTSTALNNAFLAVILGSDTPAQAAAAVKAKAE